MNDITAAIEKVKTTSRKTREYMVHPLLGKDVNPSAEQLQSEQRVVTSFAKLYIELHDINLYLYGGHTPNRENR